MKIELTETEEKLCQILDECTVHLQKEQGISTTCRIAGGWVRDKLLGSQCNDIDIALSNIMGVAFAEHLAAFAQAKGVRAGTISKIAVNPDQSKHLETATFKIFGLDIDLVNLRSEEYSETSRIPTEVLFGTPLEDARRRDITINSMFYNVHNHMVEDFTSKGLDDLHEGVIRTPLPPKETFRDDPLRVLRCIRFASRFGFELVADIKQAAQDSEIQNALVTKVARERIGDEISKMMKGQDPLHSIRLIHELALYPSIFSALPPEVSSTLSSAPSGSERAVSAAAILNTLLLPEQPSFPKVHHRLLAALQTDPSCRPRLYLATALIPYLGVTYRDKKKRLCPAVEVVTREALKLGKQNHYLDGIPLLFTAAELLGSFVTHHLTLPPAKERKTIGLILRDKSVHNTNAGAHWTASLLFSLVVQLSRLCESTKDLIESNAAASIITSYNSFVEKIEALDLTDAVEEKPILDGREIVLALGAKKHGAWVGETLAKVVEWQLEHPQGTRDDCLLWLEHERSSWNLCFDDDSSGPASKRARTK